MCLLHALSSSLHTRHQHLLKAQTMEVGLLLCKQEVGRRKIDYSDQQQFEWYILQRREKWLVVWRVSSHQLCVHSHFLSPPFFFLLIYLPLSSFLLSTPLLFSLLNLNLSSLLSHPRSHLLSSPLLPPLSSSPCFSHPLYNSLSFTSMTTTASPVLFLCFQIAPWIFWVWHLK